MTKPIRHKRAVRFFSWLLCFMLMFDTFGMTVFAETDPDAGEAVVDESVLTDPEADGTESEAPAENEAEDSQETPVTPPEEPAEDETEPSDEPEADDPEPTDRPLGDETDSDSDTDPAAETDDPDLELSESDDGVLNAAEEGVLPAKGSLVYFGGEVWRVLDPNAVANDETGQPGILLVSEYVLDDRLWDDGDLESLSGRTYQNIWDESDIRRYLGTIFELSLSMGVFSEKPAVINAVKTASGNGEVGLSGDRFFLLSKSEAMNADYFSGEADRIGRRFNDGVPTPWMLRSNGPVPSYIESTGKSFSDFTYYQYANGLRPAFYLDPTKIVSLETDAHGIQIIHLESFLGSAPSSVPEWVSLPIQNGEHYTMSANTVMAGQQVTAVFTPDPGYTIEDIQVTCHVTSDYVPETILSSSGSNVTAAFTAPAGLNSVLYDVEIRKQTITSPAIAGLSLNVNGENMPIVKYDGYDWLVIGYDGAGNHLAARDGCLTLLNRDSVKNMSYYGSAGVARYYRSNPHANCTYNAAYSGGEFVEYYPFFAQMNRWEEAALVPCALPIQAEAADPNESLTARDFYYGESRYDPNLIIGGAVNSARFRIPSAAEAAALPAQGAGSDRACWLRTPGIYGEKRGYGLLRYVSVFNGADVNYEGVSTSTQQGFRAICDLDLSKILFASPAEGGKQSGETGPDSLMPWVENTGREWKLTLLDETSEFSVDTVTGGCERGQILIHYSGAGVGYVSAMIKDSTGAIKYYGKLKEVKYAEDTSGTVSVNITDGMLGEGDELYVFYESSRGESGDSCNAGSQLILVDRPASANGHDWGEPEYELAADGSTVTAKRVCRRFEGHVETETAEVTLNTNAAGDWICSATFENPAFGTWNTTVHHEWGEPTYIWANGSGSVTATRTCTHDPAHIETETVSTKESAAQTGNTWMDSGNHLLIAEFENPAFETQSILADVYQTVWYGNRAWLNITDSEYPAGAVTLLSRDETGSLRFDAESTPNNTCVYSDPMIYAHLATLLHGGENAVFSEKEEAPIMPRVVRDPSQGLYTYRLLLSYDSYRGERVDTTPERSLLWLPSIDEAHRMFESARKMRGESWDNWWLRYVDGQGITNMPPCVMGDGTVGDHGEYQVGAIKGARPAFFLDENAVLYASPAVGGKPSGAQGPDAVTALGSPNFEWKLTLLDDGTIEGLDGHAGFTVDSAELTGNLYTITYHGAVTGPNEYIAALVKDADGNVVKYGRIKSCADADAASGTVTLRTEPGQAVYLYNEQYNGDKATDYASALYDLNAFACSLHCYHNGVCIHCGAVTDLAEVPYYDPADGTEKTFDTYSPVPENLCTMDTGVYVVTENTTLSHRLTVTGDAQLVLMDGVTLNANAGIGVLKGKTLTIWGQSGLYSVPGETLMTHGTGVLNAKTSAQAAAIGGNKAETGGDINIRGGVINATGNYGAGIGGGDIGVCGRITIDDGAVTARGGNGSAGIGGGGYSDGGFVTVNGGYVHAVGSTYSNSKQAAPGIGSGRPRTAGTQHLDSKVLTVNGGVVEAEAGPAMEGGTGAQAIGVNLADAVWNDYRKAVLADGLRVTSDGVVAEYDDRAVACRGQTARIEPCTEHEDDGSGLCRYCHLTSHWTVSFDAGGGSGTINSVRVMNGGEYTLPGFTGFTAPDGESYAGWRDVYGVVRAPGDKMQITEDSLLTAVWSETHDDVTFWSWSYQDRLPAVPGNYFLCDDVELDDEWDAPEGTTNVCLNDHKITLTMIDVTEGRTLTIYDHGEGLIDGNDYCNDLLRCNGGEVNIHGGTFRAADTNCFRIKKGSGNIYKAVISADSRTGIYVEGTGLLHIYDITRSDYGLEPLSGSRYGTAVYNMGTTIIDGGTFTGNKTRASLIRNEKTMIINGGTFTGNTAPAGIVYNTGSLSVSGGTFTGNQVNEGCGAFYGDGRMILSGEPVITGNADTAGTECNIRIHEGNRLHVGSMSDGAKIGVTMETPPGVFARAAEGYTLRAVDMARFFSDSDAYAVMLTKNREGALVDPSELPIQAEAVTLNKTDLDLTVGDEADLQASVQPGDAEYEAVYWTSSDETVVTVDESGKVKAIKVGTAVITARVDGTDVTAECRVTVNPEASSLRLCGSNRYKTSLAIANQLKKQLGLSKFSAIVLATGKDYPDALAGGYLASLKKAPIILIRADKPVSHKDNKMVAKWIKSNLKSGGTIYVLGSTNAISNNHVNLVKSGFKVSRLGGRNRFGTDIEILKACGVKSGKKTFIVTTGYDYSDALCASALSYPLFIVNTKKNIITDEQKSYLAKVKGSTFYILGSTSVVSSGLEKALKSYGTVKRVSTSGNAITRSVQTARQFTPEPKAAALAISTAFADGLCGGVLANKMGASLLLVKSGSEAKAAEFVKEKGVTSSIVFGSSEGAVPDQSVKAVFPGLKTIVTAEYK